MQKFNGKFTFADGTEKDTASEMTSATKFAGKSDKSAFNRAQTQGSRSSSPEKEAAREAAADRVGTFDPDPVRTQGDQNEIEDQLELEE